MPKVHHVAICCTDVDASLRFWRDGIGLTVTMDAAFDGDWRSLFDIDSGRLRSVFMGDPDDATAGIVELVDFGTPTYATGPVAAPPRGFFLVSLNVPLDATLARLADLGVGGDARRIEAYGVGMAVVRDPDGVQVELIDLPDGSSIQVASGVDVNHQLVIRNGLVIDGTGSPGVLADVAVDGGRITAVGAVPDRGREEIDATGHVVAPGWVDIHTHYDGQVTWDPTLSPSSWHGVTTVVMGNCGVGFAPVAPDRRDWLIQLMEGVEDIPGTALHEGIRWDWETFPEYLDALDRGRYAVDVAAQVPHAALRAYVMGDRGADHAEIPTPAEIATMGQLAAAGIEAGALGFTTSRTVNQRSADGRFTPSLSASAEELLGIARVIGTGGKGVLGAVADFVDVDEEFALLRAMAETSGRPLSISTMQVDARPDGWRRLLELMTDAASDGVHVRGQVAVRAIGVMLGLTSTANPLAGAPSFAPLADLPSAEQARLLREPDRRRAVLDELTEHQLRFMPWDRMFQLGDPPDYEPEPATSIAARAARAGIATSELAYDLLASGNGQELLYMPFNNWAGENLDNVREMLLHPLTVPGLSDAGAHCGLICDAGFPTFLLTHWGRDRVTGRLPLEWLVHQQTEATADVVGLGDRGVIEPGRRADLNVIDMVTLALRSPEIVRDLPAGGPRLVQRASGYCATVVAGEITMRDGEPTGARPGRLVRGAWSVAV